MSASFSLFSGLLAFGILVHLVNTGSWELLHHETALALVAIFALLDPSSVVRFLAMIVMQLVSWALKAPGGNNHWFLLMLVGITILLGVGILLTRRPRRLDAASLYELLAPVLRIEIVAVYLVAGFAKLNRDFFDKDLSAAVGMYGDLRDRLPFLPEGSLISNAVIFFTLAVEFGAPLLLLFGRTRVAGLAMLLGFHFTVALVGHTPFSAIAMAFLALFLPPGFPAWFRRVADDHPQFATPLERLARWARSPTGFAVVAGGWLLVAAVQTFEWLDPDDVRRVVIRASQLAYTIEAIAAMALLFVAWRRFDDWGPTVGLRLAHPLLLAGPVLLLLNASSPYVGLKTENSFTMFSNLQTESSQWNHLLLPEQMRVFSTQDDLVEIIASDDPELADDADNTVRWVETQFRQYVSERPDLTVRFLYRGEEQLIEPGVESEFTEPLGLLARKLMKYRPVPLPEDNTLRH